MVVLEIIVEPNESPRFTPLWEFAPTLLGIALSVLLSPRMASWETFGWPRLRIRAATMAAFGIVVPAVVPWIVHFRLPADARWWDISCNVAVYTSVSFGAVAYLGRIIGPISGMGVYFATIMIQQAVPNVAYYFPVSGASTNLVAHPISAMCAVVIASAIWYFTIGQSTSAKMLQRNS